LVTDYILYFSEYSEKLVDVDVGITTDVLQSIDQAGL